jgi:hypothetical protein
MVKCVSCVGPRFASTGAMQEKEREGAAEGAQLGGKEALLVLCRTHGGGSGG